MPRAGHFLITGSVCSKFYNNTTAFFLDRVWIFRGITFCVANTLGRYIFQAIFCQYVCNRFGTTFGQGFIVSCVVVWILEWLAVGMASNQYAIIQCVQCEVCVVLLVRLGKFSINFAREVVNKIRGINFQFITARIKQQIRVETD